MALPVQAAVQAVTAFSATNVDDLFILMLFFSRLGQGLRSWHVVVGQYLGIAVLVAISLLSLLGRLAVPAGWIGLLGLVPISLGLRQLAESCDAPDSSDGAEDLDHDRTDRGWWAATVGVAALTIANGGDNISVYAALLANSDTTRIVVFLLIFALLTGVWCLLAWGLTQASGLARPLRRFQRDLAPLLLVGIGLLVLWDSQLPVHPALAVVALACLAAMVLSLIQALAGSRSEPAILVDPPP